jgi:hypothetical protein
MRHLITLLLMLPILADAQIYIDSYRFGIPAPAPGLLLDSFPATWAVSVRKLTVNYTGDCMTIRRTSDSDTLNIGFVNNYADTASIKSFCSGTQCRITRWYDQVGSLNPEQSDTTLQPLVYSSGDLSRSSSGKFLIKSDTINDNLTIPNSTASFNYLHNGTSSSGLFVGQSFNSSPPTSSSYYLYSTQSVQNVIGFWIAGQTTNTNLRNVVANNTSSSSVNHFTANTSYPGNAFSTVFFLVNAGASPASARSLIYVNNQAVSQANTNTGAPNASNASSNFGILLRAQGSELIAWDTNQAANQTAIQANINTFYSIY